MTVSRFFPNCNESFGALYPGLILLSNILILSTWWVCNDFLLLFKLALLWILMILIILYLLAIHILSSVEYLCISFIHSNTLFLIDLFELFICYTNYSFDNICGNIFSSFLPWSTALIRTITFKKYPFYMSKASLNIS